MANIIKIKRKPKANGAGVPNSLVAGELAFSEADAKLYYGLDDNGVTPIEIAGSGYVLAKISENAPTKSGGGATGTWNISISGNAATVTSGVYTNRTLTAGSGLVGGGDLSANRTFDIGQGDGISVSADAIAVDSTVVRTTGTQTINGAKSFYDIANNNILLTTIDDVIKVKAPNTSNTTYYFLGLDGGGSPPSSAYADRSIVSRSTSQIKSDLSLDNVQNIALSGITFTAGSGLAGGGNLSANRSFDIGQGDGISVTSDAIAVDSTVVRTTGTQTINGSKTFGNAITFNSGLSVNSQKITSLAEPTASADAATKNYVDNAITSGIATNDAMIFKGAIDCSANPNYPAADRGWTYKVSVAGKIGGASGITVEVNDTLICTTDSTATGNHATVGSNWIILQTNITDASILVTGPASATSGNFALFDGTTGKIIKDAGFAATTVGQNIVKLTNPSAISFLRINADNTITALSDTNFRTAIGVNDGTLTLNVTGTGLSGSQTFTANQSGNATFTVTSNATSANTASAIVARDASGNFSAGTITASLNGNASTVTNGVYTSRSISTTNGITGGGDLSADRTLQLATAYGDTVNPYGSKTQNTVLAAPTGANGVPSFRSLVANDIPSLGNITNAGAIGSTANLPIITTTNGALTTGSFGTTANTFCQGNDSRLSDTRNTTNSLTVNNGGAGTSSPFTFNGSTAQTLSYNSIGAPSISGTNATGTWNINITGNAATVTSGVYTNRNITIAGTANQITSSAGAQDLSADRTWTLSLPQNIHSGATPTFAGLTANGNISVRAPASANVATQIVVFSGDPSSTTQNIVTRTPAQLLSDIGGYAASNPNGYTNNTGTVTSVTAGSGMSFTNVTTSGPVNMGTPSSITLSSTNSLTSNSHTHAFAPGGTTAQYIRGDGVLASGATLSKTDDTNVTLTLGGSPTNSLLSAVSLTLGWTGNLAVNRGGTGQTSYSNGELLIGNSTGNTLTKATLTQGTGIVITNGAGSISVAHNDTSLLNGLQGGNGISSITVDDFGHVTAVGTATYLTSATVCSAIADCTIDGGTF